MAMDNSGKIKRALEVVVDSLPLAITNQFGMKILSLAVAVVLWTVVLGSRNVEITKEVPIEILLPEQMVVANDVPATVSFRLKGPKAFLRSILEREEPSIKVDLMNSKPGLVTYRFRTEQMKVPIGVQVEGLTPASLLIRIENVRFKTVPIKLELQGAPPAGLELVRAEIAPTSTKIRGARSKVKNVTEVLTRPIDLSTATESFETELALDVAGMGIEVVDEESVTARLEFKKVAPNFRIDGVPVMVKSDRRAKVEPDIVSLLVWADDPELLKGLGPEQVTTSVDLSGKARGTYEVKPQWTVPQGIKVIRMEPQEIKVTLF